MHGPPPEQLPMPMKTSRSQKTLFLVMRKVVTPSKINMAFPKLLGVHAQFPMLGAHVSFGGDVLIPLKPQHDQNISILLCPRYTPSQPLPSLHTVARIYSIPRDGKNLQQFSTPFERGRQTKTENMTQNTPLKFKIAPENGSSQKDSSLPSLIFHGLC